LAASGHRHDAIDDFPLQHECMSAMCALCVSKLKPRSGVEML